jgi:hypothetical protein
MPGKPSDFVKLNYSLLGQRSYTSFSGILTVILYITIPIKYID